MKASMSTSGSCHLVRFSHGNVHSSTHQDVLTLVLDMLNSGVLGDGAHGSDAHLVALQRVMERANAVAKKISDSRRADD